MSPAELFRSAEEDTGPAGGISIKTRSRRRAVEIASVSSETHTIFSRATSRCRPVRVRGAFRGAIELKDILINIDEDLAGPEVLQEFGARRRSLRLRFPPY